MSVQQEEPGKLAPAPGQLSLSLDDRINDALSPKARGRYTAEQFKKLRPEDYALTVELLSKGVFSKREIARVVDVAYETVIAVGLEQDSTIRAGKKGMVKALELVLAYAMDTLIERAKAGQIAPLEVAIIVDKYQLLTGGATERVAHVQEEDPDVAEYRRFLAAQDVTPHMALEMGSEVGKLLQEGAVAFEGAGTFEGLEAPIIELQPVAMESASLQDGTQPPDAQ